MVDFESPASNILWIDRRAVLVSRAVSITDCPERMKIDRTYKILISIGLNVPNSQAARSMSGAFNGIGRDLSIGLGPALRYRSIPDVFGFGLAMMLYQLSDRGRIMFETLTLGGVDRSEHLDHFQRLRQLDIKPTVAFKCSILADGAISVPFAAKVAPF